ncbi:MAG TPA: DUF1697 domain-containing protein [Streptosporangiaceae bacterium]|nr:DUF1697 domain-containing protein [Streptosporangiaceae bacterium]
MPTHVALLRGINVGGHNKVTMADLREVATGLGHTEVTTYIQSGNVLFTTTETDTAALAATFEEAIAANLGVRARVVVLSREDLARAIGDNPYPGETNPKLIHATFLSEDPGPGMVGGVAAAQRQAQQKGGRDTAQVVGRTLFLHTPDGYGRSELAAQLVRMGNPEGPGMAGTARNWATVIKLLALCDG